MKKSIFPIAGLFGLLLSLLFVFSACNNDPYTYAEIETNHGTMKVMLYNSTPQHRDNFIKLVKEGFYEDLLFHRVIANFMFQGGDPQSRNAPPGQALGSGGPGYTIPAEIGAPHLKGALSAARLGDQVNPQKESSGSQFYIVQGTVQTDDQLNAFEHRKRIKYSEAQRKLYTEIGGFPSLDGDYTVFGEVLSGFDVIDKIGGQTTASGDRPLEDITMKIRILN